MHGPFLMANEIAATDAAQILQFLNAVQDAPTLTRTIGFSEGGDIAHSLATSILLARPFRRLEDVERVTGVNPARFTELAMALSGARPFQATDRIHFLTPQKTLWLGQTINLTAQVTDSRGHGSVRHHVTCIASTGALTARSGLQVQSGSAIRIAPEPGGIIRFSFAPDRALQQDLRQHAALSAALSLLPETARAPADADKTFLQFAERYRGQRPTPLQSAVDQMFDLFDMPSFSRTGPWPIAPVTLIALLQDADGQVLQATSTTLEQRNWLGAFYDALKGRIQQDTTLRDALENLRGNAEDGRDLSAQIVQAMHGFAGLEHGKLGGKLRDAASGPMLNAFLSTTTQNLEGNAIVNTVRTAGASSAAIRNGGFDVFDAVRHVQDVDAVVRPRADLEGVLMREDLAPITSRLGTLEGSVATTEDLTQLEQNLNTGFSSRISALEDGAVSQGNLETLRGDITADVNARFEAFDPTADFEVRLRDIGLRFDALAETQITQTDLDQFQNVLAQDFGAQLTDQSRRLNDRIAEVEAMGVTKDDFDQFARDFDTKLEQFEPSSKVDRRFEDIEGQLSGLQNTFVSNEDLATVTRDFDGKLEELDQNDHLNAQLDAVTARLETIERGTVTQDQFKAFTQEFDAKLAQADASEQISALDARMAGLERSRLTRRDLTNLERSLTKDFDAKLTEFESERISKDQFEDITKRLNGLEEDSLRKSDLEEFRVDMNKDLGARIDAVENREMRDPRVDDLRRDVNADMDAKLENTVKREEMDARIVTVERNMDQRLRGKANAQTVAAMSRSLTQMRRSQAKLETSVGQLETQGTFTPIGPVFRPRG